MYRINQDLSRCSTTYETGQIYVCAFCDKMFKTLYTLNYHTTETHPERFDSVVWILQINKSVEEPLQKKEKVPESSKCQGCETRFYTNEYMEAHKTKGHDY